MTAKINLKSVLLGLAAIALLLVCGFGVERSSRMSASESEGSEVNMPTEAVRPASANSTCLSLDRLLQIEHKSLPSVLTEGPNRQATLPEYYWAENRELLSRFEQAKETFACTPPPTHRMVTLVAGTAGVGKTFLKKEVFSKDYPESAVCKFDVGELFEQWTAEGIAGDTPDVACAGIVLNRLKSVRNKKKTPLYDYLVKQNASFYVIDSLDEIHPDDHAWVLEQVEDFVFERSHRFVHVAVFGRGASFREYWKERREQGEGRDIGLFLLNPPKFRSTGDLLVSNWNYHTWKYGLEWAPPGGEPKPMSLDDYAAWIDSGFAVAGRFQMIACDENQDMRADVQNRLHTCARNYPVVCATLRNLAGNSLIREILREDVLAREPYSERRIMRAYFLSWLERETGAHGLPSGQQPTYLDLYLAILEQIAATYLDSGTVDDGGFFRVGHDDQVTVAQADRRLSFSAKRVLDASGLVFTDPRDTGETRYRFEPIWLHRMLVEMHNDRMVGGQHSLVAGLSAD